jgi:lipid-binding SYLF domain-containing protein
MALLFGGLAAYAQAVQAVDQQQVVNRALSTVEMLKTQAAFRNTFISNLSRAHAVLIVPDFYKGAFIIGGSWGNGILLARTNGGGFGSPAFYSLTSGTFGLQLGLEDASVTFLVMTDKGLDAVLQNQFKIGVNAGVTVVVVGAGMGADTTSAMGADILAYSQGAVGLFGGIALEGAIITPRDSWNLIYYGKDVAARDIVLGNVVSNPEADKLRDFLAH